MTIIEDAGRPPKTQEQYIRVKNTANPNQLGGSVSQALYDSPTVTLACVGAASVNQAIKALVVARSMVAARGLNLVMAPGMETTKNNARPGAGGSDELTRTLLRVWTQQ